MSKTESTAFPLINGLLASQRVCKPNELEALSKQGWFVDQVIIEETHEPGIGYTEMVPNPGGGYPVSFVQGSPSVVVKHPLFLLFRHRDTEIESLRAEIAAKDERVQKATADLDAMTKAKSAAEKSLDEKTTSANVNADSAKYWQTKYDEVITTKNKLENDIGKIRREVGEARVREILK